MVKIIFFQPHPDDLELNCAYLLNYLALKSNKNHDIRIASITKGEFGLPGFNYDKYKGDYLAQIRVKELENAAAIHGISANKIDWFGYIDGFVEFNKPFVQHIFAYLQEHRPDIIIAPEGLYTWYYHKDHINTGRAIYYVISNNLLDYIPKLYFYSTLSPNYYFPINQSISLTERLIKCHKTQVWLLKKIKKINKPVWTISGFHTQGFKYAEPYRYVCFEKKLIKKNRPNWIIRGLVRLIASHAQIFDAQYPEEILKKLNEA